MRKIKIFNYLLEVIQLVKIEAKTQILGSGLSGQTFLYTCIVSPGHIHTNLRLGLPLSGSWI